MLRLLKHWMDHTGMHFPLHGTLEIVLANGGLEPPSSNPSAASVPTSPT